MEAVAFLDCGSDAVNYVVDVSEIAHHRAIAIDGYGFTLFDEFCEFVDGKVWPLARAIDGKKPQAGYRDFVKVVICVADELAGLFGCGVGRNWKIDIVCFGEREFFIVAVDA